jgi:hypothetical protein
VFVFQQDGSEISAIHTFYIIITNQSQYAACLPQREERIYRKGREERKGFMVFLAICLAG